MAILFMDSFDLYGTSNGVPPVGLTYRYTAAFANLMDVEAGRIGGHSLEMNGTSVSIETPALTTHNTLIVGFACEFRDAPTGAVSLLTFLDGATVGMNVQVDQGLQFIIRRGTTVLQTVSGNGSNRWAYIEFKVVTGASGSYELRVNQQTVAQASGVNTQAGSNAFHDRFRINGVANNGQRLDDLFCLDGSGSANNNFLGNKKVVATLPTAEGDTTQFTPSAGTDNAAMIDDNPIDDDSTHVESNTVGNKDLYQYADVSGLGPIAGVQVTTVCKNTSGTTHALKTVVKSGATESVDGGQSNGASYVAVKRVLEQDPNTSAPWTESGYNAAQFGVEVS